MNDRAPCFDGADHDPNAKLVTLAGQFQDMVTMALSPAGSLNTYGDEYARAQSDVTRTSGELRSLLAARGQ